MTPDNMNVKWYIRTLLFLNLWSLIDVNINYFIIDIMTNKWHLKNLESGIKSVPEHIRFDWQLDFNIVCFYVCISSYNSNLRTTFFKQDLDYQVVCNDWMLNCSNCSIIANGRHYEFTLDAWCNDESLLTIESSNLPYKLLMFTVHWYHGIIWGDEDTERNHVNSVGIFILNYIHF